MFYISSYFWDRATDVGLIPDTKSISVVISPSDFRPALLPPPPSICHAAAPYPVLAAHFVVLSTTPTRQLARTFAVCLNDFKRGQSCTLN